MQAERRPNLPTAIGRYRIVGRLGKGAMGVVYSAIDDVMERSVAIKVMMADLEEDPETSARFQREARAAGLLAHRNVITIYDMGQDGGRPYIVMELVEGYQLGDYLKRPESGALELKVDLMRQIAEGLQAAHAHAIFHRDVKPGNLLIRSDGVVKILDFGIARLASSSMTASGLIVGTPDYMSPEQARGQDVDQRSDIFSAGAVFYFILTGRKPFAGSDLPTVLNKVEREDPLPLRENEAPPALARIVMKALSKAPTARYQHCGELLADLNQFRRLFDLETRNLAESLRQKLTAVETLADERRRLAERITPQAALSGTDAIRSELLERSPAFKDWLGGDAGIEPLVRSAIVDLQSEMTNVHKALAADVGHLRIADSALSSAARALAAGDLESALESFEKALEAVPACLSAREDADRCRRRLEERQAGREEARALVNEARGAAQQGHWKAVAALCDKALALDGQAAGVVELRNQAAKALDLESRDRRRAEQSAAQREEALRHAKAAEAALETNDPQRALELVKRALAADPSSTLGRKILGLASARLKAEADAKARVAEAAERLRSARALVAKGKYRKAREMLAAASVLDPQNGEPAAVLAEIHTLEARAIEERERAQLAERKARAIAPMLAAARTAEAGRDLTRAVWTAENILAIDPESAEARQILERAREALAAQPALADETVDALRDGRDGADPERTVRLIRMTTFRRIVAAVVALVGGSRARLAPRPAGTAVGKRRDPSGKGV